MQGIWPVLVCRGYGPCLYAGDMTRACMHWIWLTQDALCLVAQYVTMLAYAGYDFLACTAYDYSVRVCTVDGMWPFLRARDMNVLAIGYKCLLAMHGKFLFLQPQKITFLHAWKISTYQHGKWHPFLRGWNTLYADERDRCKLYCNFIPVKHTALFSKAMDRG
jgi:hypothetical protein